MGRGQTAEVGATRVAQNGYHYTKVGGSEGENGWRLTHHITAEKMLGRPLRSDEMVKFVDKSFKRHPYDPKGIKVIKMKTTSLRKRLAVLEARIEEMTAEKIRIEKQLANM